MFFIFGVHLTLSNWWLFIHFEFFTIIIFIWDDMNFGSIYQALLDNLDSYYLVNIQTWFGF